MTSPKVKLEGKKIAEKVMDFIDMKSFDPIYEEIEKSEDYHVYIREIMRCIPTMRIIHELDERGELYEAYKEYIDLNGQDLIKDMTKEMSVKENSNLYRNCSISRTWQVRKNTEKRYPRQQGNNITDNY